MKSWPLKPKWIMLIGLVIIGIGILINYLYGVEGTVRLPLGIPVEKYSFSRLNGQSTQPPSGLDFSMRLDSLRALPFTPVYEIQVRESDTAFIEGIHPGVSLPSKAISRYKLEPMKIRKIGKSDFRYRLNEFYPDFTFKYTYPDKQDTIPPRAPGITFNMVSPEGEAIVTLRSDQPGRHKIDDIVQLGAAFEFYWTISPDSILYALPDTGSQPNKIVFSGKDRQVYFVFDRKIDAKPLVENSFYSLPGKDSLGFTILHCFPDVALLKAVPASKSDQMLNPVAKIEVWRIGEGSKEIYIYPETKGKHGGQFKVPGTNLFLALGISNDVAVKACHCDISILDPQSQILQPITFLGTQVKSFDKFRLKVLECDVENRTYVTVGLGYWPGRYLMMAGGSLFLLSLLLLFFSKNPSKPLTP